MKSALLFLLLAASSAAPIDASTPASAPPALAAGDVVPAFEAQAIDGVMKRVEFPNGSRTVLLFFTSSCPVCHRMLPVWSQWYARKPKDLAVVGVMLDREPPGFFTMMPVAFPVVRSPGAEFLRTFKVHRVPMTARIGPGGKVDDAAQGEIDAIRLGQLFRP